MFNLLKTAVLMAAITALFMAIGSLHRRAAGHDAGAASSRVGMNFFSYWFSDKLVLKMYNAQEVDATSAPQFYAMVRRAGAARRPADAARLPDRGRRAERLRHRPQPRACGGGGDDGHPARA